MTDNITPLNCIRQLQFQKYKAALVPIIIILAGFLLKLNGIEIPVIITSIVMGISFAAYLVVLYIYRLGNPKIPTEENILLAPVHGLVHSVEMVNGMVRIRIDKSFFDPIEIRCPVTVPVSITDLEDGMPYGEHSIQLNFGEKMPLVFHEHGTVPASLLGLVRGGFHVSVSFNEAILKNPVEIKKGDVVIAGETILAELK
ncbi:MAG TPA: hypothetical protein PLE74_00360 [Candidatus Cloacimonadota bacterium]|nr:hypothetical protein [Candidatus Cloacimonadota bacterium]HPT70712.1 hypothetical protein [Candidatus Cloacimonadota bacterium]